MFRTVLKCGGPFSFFLRSALSREEEGSSTSFTWPCPMPFPEAFAKSFAPGLWRKRLLNLSVAYLSFLHLGRPCACPPAVRLGVPLNRKQWQAVQGLKHLVFGSFFPLQFEAADYGRVGHKVEGQSKVLETLGRAAASLCRSFAGYQPPAPLACSFAGASPVAEEVGLLPGKPDVSRERAVRNLICGSLTRSEAAFVFDCPAADLPAGGTGILCGLSSLAMGDSSACEFAQCSHLGVLVQGRAVYPGELLLQASSPPRSLLSIGLVIDDLVVLQRCWTEQLEDLRARPGSSLGARRLRSALSAYDAAKLRYSAKKTFEEATQASFWGADCCGVSGLVRPNPARYWPLVLITARVLQLGLATRALLES
eukprot:s9058_g1.t1